MAIDINVPVATNQMAADLAAMAINTKMIVCGDGTGETVLRVSKLTIADGTAANSVKVKLESDWNGDTIAEEDNLVIGNGTNFSWQGSGVRISGGLSGNVLAVFLATIYRNTINEATYGLCVNASPTASNEGMNIILSKNYNAAAIDISYFGAGDEIIIYLSYLTDA